MPITVSNAFGLVNAVSRRWYGWLIFYIAVSAVTFTFFRSSQGTELFYPGSGIILAALLTLPRSGHSQLLFLISAGVASFFLKTKLTQVPPIESAVLSLTLMLQAWLGATLIRRYSPASAEPVQVSAVIGFMVWGALIPVAVSALLVALSSGWPTQATVLYTWLNWFSLRGLSTLLIAPFLLLLCSAVAQVHAYRPIRRPIESLLMLVLVVEVSALVFSTSNPDGRALATYSFMMVPLLIWCAIRLELAISAIMTLAMAITALWFDSGYSGGDQGQVERSLMALSIFLAINQAMVLLLAALVSDRQQAIGRARRLSRMYESLSKVNQTLVQENNDEDILFERVCRIVTNESEFDQACISKRAPFSSAAFSHTIIFSKEETQPITSVLPLDDCPPIKQVIANHGAVFFNDLQQRRSCTRDCVLQFDKWPSVAGLPILKEGKLYAVLTVCHKKPQIFDADAIRLMKEMTGDLSFALDNIERNQHLKLTAEVFEHSRESIIIADANSNILSVNRAFTMNTGYSAAEAIGRNPRFLQSGQQDEQFYEAIWDTVDKQNYWYGDIWSRRKNGETFPQRGTISAVRDTLGNPLHYIAILEDISQHLEAEQQIQQLANFDPLTGLPNRILLQDRFDRAIQLCKREGSGLALLFLDLDDFKHVNDAMGHAYGDELLCAVSQRLQEHLRDSDTLARFGGDEFVLLAQGGMNEAAAMADRLINASTSPYLVSGQTLNIGASIGIALYPDNKDSLNELIQCADAAMYRAKGKGRGTFEFYSPDMQENAHEKLAIKKDLREAMEHGDLQLHYQPQVDLGSNKVIGLEALIRWQHPERGMVSPGLFIPLAEESGQIVAVDQWVLEAAITQISLWQEAGLPLVPVAVNLSLAQFLRRDLVRDIKSLLEHYRVAPALLELELNERIAIADSHYTIDTLTALHELGVSLSIDDFGTGYSSLSYLRRYPVDTLKIDMTFIQSLEGDVESQGIVRTIISLAKSLDLNVIAEGVETHYQLNFLMQQECDAYQGYLFSKPLPVEDMLALMKPAV